jgi:hypothetical protein
MKHNICPELTDQALTLDVLTPWDVNPHNGNVPAIMASYDQFGQLKPIVVHTNGDDTYTIIAGNHQAEAAKRLGWTHIAATRFKGTRKEAIAFALADNRTTQLGSDDPVLLHQALILVADDFPEMFDVLGWDEFQRAAMEEQVEYLTIAESEPSGYVAPVMLSQPGEPFVAQQASQPSPAVKNESDETEDIVAPAGIDQHDAITRGSTAVGAGGAKAIVQYSLVFDDADQQRRWYDFLRWLRTDAEINGETTAERLLDFLEARVDF